MAELARAVLTALAIRRKDRGYQWYWYHQI
jgi:hypothetical protein